MSYLCLEHLWQEGLEGFIVKLQIAKIGCQNIAKPLGWNYFYGE